MIEELRCNDKIVGLKQTIRAIEGGHAKKAFLSKDCAPHIFNEIEHNCNKYKVPVEYVDTMSELGKVCGIDVGAAVAVITK